MQFPGRSSIVNLACMAACLLGVSEASAAEPGRLYLIDSQFTPAVTRIFEVDLTSAALALKGDLGVDYTPVLGMAAANDLTFYIAGTDTSGANACDGYRSCLLLKVVLDPASSTPALVQLVGVMNQGGEMVPEITGMTFRQDGQLYAISQVTYSLYRIDLNTAEATLVGSAGLELHGGDITFDDRDRLFAWTNIGAGSGVYLMDPATGLASAYELHPGLDFAGMAALQHGNLVYGASAGSDRLYTLDLMGGMSNLLMSFGGVRFDHARGDLDSPYCGNDASCADEDICTADTCSPGGCRHDAIPGCCVTDSQCDDGNACTQDQCQANRCVVSAISLDDGNPCTEDLCSSAGGMTHLPIAGCCVTDSQCDDGNACTQDQCQANRCVVSAISLDDGNPCTEDLCSSAGGTTHLPISGCCVSDGDCDDHSACTLDRCEAGRCTSSPVSVDDGDACTLDECDPILGPVHVSLSDVDRDGDGVSDCLDLCPGTARKDAVNADGCSVDQLCPCADSPKAWNNHGEYMKCVTQQAGAIFTASGRDAHKRGEIVRQAARSSCGNSSSGNSSHHGKPPKT